LTPLTDLEARVTAALDKWAAVADISFAKLPSDSGVAINDPTAVPSATGQIRIGVFAFSSGAEGDAYDTTFAPNDFETLLLHEVGHTFGLAHPVFDGTCPVMQADSACFPMINRELDADDIAGAQFLYGAAVVPVPGAIRLFGSGLIGLIGLRRRKDAAFIVAAGS
jgi:Matrixin